jgi:hypothetical protein
MEHYKATELVVVFPNTVSYSCPILHGKIAGIQQGIELDNGVQNAITFQCASDKRGERSK